jgi:hypothetical protein
VLRLRITLNNLAKYCIRGAARVEYAASRVCPRSPARNLCFWRLKVRKITFWTCCVSILSNGYASERVCTRNLDWRTYGHCWRTVPFASKPFARPQISRADTT